MSSQATYYIHNTTRSPHTRQIRRAVLGPESSTKNLFIGGGLLRVVRGRPTPATEGVIRRVLAELVDKESKGLVAVYDSKSRRVDLRTLEPLKDAPPPPAEVDIEDEVVIHEEPVTAVDVPLPSGLVSLEEAAPEEPWTPEPAVDASTTGNEDPAPAQDNPFFGGRKKNRR